MNDDSTPDTSHDEPSINATGPISSVNSRGNQSKGGAGKVIFIFAVIAALILVGFFAFNYFRAQSKEKEAQVAAAEKEEKRQAQASSMVKIRTFDDAPTGTAYAAAGQPQPSSMPPVPGGGVPAPVAAQHTQPIYADSSYAGTGAGAASQQPTRSRFDGDVMMPAASGGSQPIAAQLPPPPAGLDLLRAALSQQGGAGGGLTSTAGAGSSGNSGGALGNSLQATRTPKVSASMLGNRNFTLAKGKSIDCALSIKVISGQAGMASCVVSRDVYSDNGRVVLLEKGSEATGEWAAAMQQGQRRLPVLWTRIRTPYGVVINIDSPGADELGTAGITGYVDNRWGERLGAAFLLSLVEDAIGYATAKESGGQGLAVLSNSTDNTKSMAEKVLDATINIKPTIYANQGDRAVITVARDLDFGGVYGLSLK